MADYVNEPVDEQRKSPESRGRCHSGGSRVFLVVGVSFGLLCIVQAALNISLRLQGTRSDHINSTNITMMSPADIRKLLRERQELISEIVFLSLNEKWLGRRVYEQQKEIEELQAEIKRLSEMGSQHGPCPRGWRFHMSSCYRLSTEKKNWRDATEDCERNGAQLVVLNDDSEAEILRTFGSAVMWIGLRAQSGTWMWGDGRLLTVEDQKKFSWHRTLETARLALPTVQSDNDMKKVRPGDSRLTCAYAKQLLPDKLTFVPANCADQHYWVCEMMVM